MIFISYFLIQKLQNDNDGKKIWLSPKAVSFFYIEIRNIVCRYDNCLNRDTIMVKETQTMVKETQTIHIVNDMNI